MKTITSITSPVFALFAFACFAAAAGALGAESIDEGLNAAAAGVLGAESIDEGLNLPEQSDMVNVSPELAGVETQTVLGLYNSSTHQTGLWYMNNNVHVGTVAGPRVPAGWRPVSAADFNGDGHIDVLLFNPTTRQTWIGYLFGATTGNYGPTLPSGWQLVGTADFNQDGHPDFLLESRTLTRQTAIWYMNNNIRISGAWGPTLGRNFLPTLVGVSDFNGDGNPDYLFTRFPRWPDTRLLTLIWYMNNNVYVGSAWGPSIPLGWVLVGATDFNRDGRADYLLISSNQTAILYGHRLVGGPRIPSGWDLFAP